MAKTKDISTAISETHSCPSSSTEPVTLLHGCPVADCSDQVHLLASQYDTIKYRQPVVWFACSIIPAAIIFVFALSFFMDYFLQISAIGMVLSLVLFSPCIVLYLRRRTKSTYNNIQWVHDSEHDYNHVLTQLHIFSQQIYYAQLTAIYNSTLYNIRKAGYSIPGDISSFSDTYKTCLGKLNEIDERLKDYIVNHYCFELFFNEVPPVGVLITSLLLTVFLCEFYVLMYISFASDISLWYIVTGVCCICIAWVGMCIAEYSTKHKAFKYLSKEHNMTLCDSDTETSRALSDIVDEYNSVLFVSIVQLNNTKE